MEKREPTECGTWELALFKRLARAKNDLEAALLDTHSFAALRMRVRQIHADLASAVSAFAKIFEEEAHADDDDAGISEVRRDERSGQGC
jgi:hypothetical protein